MSQKDDKILLEEAQARRTFLKKAAIIGATAPAAALLMSAKPNQAHAAIYDNGQTTTGTFTGSQP